MKALLRVKHFFSLAAPFRAPVAPGCDTLTLTGAEDRAMRGRNPSADSGDGPGWGWRPHPQLPRNL